MTNPKPGNAKKPSAKFKGRAAGPTKQMQPSVVGPTSGNQAAAPASKQDRIVTMLQSPAGTTIDAMMEATGWQQHSVRGFLAGVVRKKLKLKLNSAKIDGCRIYRIDQSGTAKTGNKSSRRRVA